MSLRRAALLASMAAGCGFHPGGELDPTDGGPVDDGGNRTVTLRDDTAADFTMPGTITEQLVVEPWGALAPVAYHVGGLLAHAANTERFGEPDEATWADVIDGEPAGTGFLTRSLAGDPVGVGLDSGDSWTYWAEGELWLDAGPTTFLIDADDAGFIELAPPGGAFTRVVTARYGVSTGTFTAGAAGWYPIRLAVREGIGASKLDIQLYPGSGTTAEPLSAARLRTRVDALRGAVLAGWDNSLLQGEPIRTLATSTMVDANFGNGVPRDLGITAADFWSLRWSGQFYVTTAGAYKLRVESDDGHRLYVGDALRSDTLAMGSADRTVEVALVAGWNDFVLDLNENTGDARARLRVVEGPEPGLDRELPASRLRPLEPRAERVETGADPDDVGVPDNDPNGGAEATVAVRSHVGATVHAVDVMVTVNHTRLADLQVRLVHPGGNSVVLRENSDAGGNGTRTLRFATDVFDGTPATGTWKVRVTDTVQGNSGTLTDVQLAVHTAGGPEQVARTAAFTSLVRDLGAGVVSIDRLRFGGHVPATGAIAVRLRGCDAPEQCAAVAWSEPLGDGAVPGLAPTRYVQYRVELTSDGAREPELDWLELEYRAPAL